MGLCRQVLNDLLYTGVIRESRVEGLSLNGSKVSTPTEEVSIGLKSVIEGVSTRLKHLQSAIEEVSTHQKDLKSAIKEISTHLKEFNQPLKMSTPIEEKKEVSTDLKSTIEEFSTHLKESNYEDWIQDVTKLVECLSDFCDQHFPSSIQQKISDIEHQIGLCIQLYIASLDSDDLLYFNEQMKAEEDAERLLRRTEKRAFQAF
ncbi:hypothetical protein H5410_016609 [Solanum commersonii]|uniref:Uncharacterized protein n=1 Tax=Solanum commersonii TaxID=4109 RepID=A0A9J5ZWY6_SOLCO|nr:hypothetical protein H5410_016609 [Solanum commersonii]